MLTQSCWLCCAGAQVQAWRCVHNVLQAHAAAVKAFRALMPDGRISINLNCDWAQPFSASGADAVSPLYRSPVVKMLVFRPRPHFILS